MTRESGCARSVSPLTAGPEAALWFTEYISDKVASITTGGCTPTVTPSPSATHDSHAEPVGDRHPTPSAIGATYAPLMITADAGFNTQLSGGMPIMASQFKGQIGLSEMPHAAGGWHDWSQLRVEWRMLQEYGRAVRECIEGYLERLTVRELERPVDMRAHGLGMWRGLDVYNVHGVGHPRIHGGETACLKGLQGVVGWANAPHRVPEANKDGGPA